MPSNHSIISTKQKNTLNWAKSVRLNLSQNSKFKSDLNARIYQFALDVIELTNLLPNKRSAWVIADQLIRAATSIGANVVEGKAASSRLEFKKYYEIALKSANESKYWLHLLTDSKLVEAERAEKLISENAEICNMLAAGVMKLKKN
jgi:four helix bundle protein